MVIKKRIVGAAAPLISSVIRIGLSNVAFTTIHVEGCVYHKA